MLTPSEKDVSTRRGLLRSKEFSFIFSGITNKNLHRQEVSLKPVIPSENRLQIDKRPNVLQHQPSRSIDR